MSKEIKPESPTDSPSGLPPVPLFADVLALGIYRREPSGMVTMIPIENSMEPVRGCTLQGVVWLQTPTTDQRAAIIAQIPIRIEGKECWPSARAGDMEAENVAIAANHPTCICGRSILAAELARGRCYCGAVFLANDKLSHEEGEIKP